MRTFFSLFLAGGLAALCHAQNTVNPFSELTTSALDSTYKAQQMAKQPQMALLCAQTLLQKAEKQYAKNDSHYLRKVPVLADAHYWLGQYETAETLLQSALTTTEAQYGTDNNIYGTLLEELFFNVVQRNKNKEATALLDKLQPKHPKGFDFVYRKVNVHFELGQTDEALNLLLLVQHYVEDKNIQNSDFYCGLLRTIGDLVSEDGRDSEAEQLFLRGLEMRKKIEPNVTLAYIDDLVYLGQFYSLISKENEAEDLFLKAESLCRANFGAEVEAYGWICLKNADLYRRQGKSEQAIPLYQRALPIFEKTKTKLSDGYSFSLNNMASTYANMKQFDKAQSLFLEVLQLKEKIYGKKHYEYFYTLNSICRLYQRMQKPDEALHYALLGLFCNSSTWETAPDFSQQLIAQIPEAYYYNNSNTFATLNNLLNVCDLYYAQTQDISWLQKAYSLSEAAVKLREAYKNKQSNEADQLSSLQLQSIYSKRGMNNAYRLYQQSKEVRFLDGAFAFAEQSKAVLLADALKAQRARQLSDIPEDLAIQELNLKQDLATLQKLLIETKDEARKSSVRERFTAKSKELDAFKKSLEKNYPKYFAIKYASSIADVPQIQATLPDKSALLAYQVGDTSTYLFVITKSNFQVLKLALRLDSLNKQTALLRKNLSDYEHIKNNLEQSYREFSATAHWFYTQLVQPALLQNSAIEQLIFVPDNALAHLPFEVFLTEPAQEKGSFKDLAYLVKKYAVNYSYSATLWLENSKAANNAPDRPATFLGMAASYKFEPSFLQLPRSSQQLSLRSGVADLPEAQKEVQQLESLFNGTFLYGADATEINLKQHIGQAGVVHLAMHGILNQKNPILSSLVLTENGDAKEDNFLQAYEIAHLPLSAQLVVLSACETGYGKFQQGEGVMSLARSFMLAGVPSLVVSLWEVNDASTQQLMTTFYQELANGANKSVALQRAKLQYIDKNTGLAAHPAFWSAFVLQGNDAPVSLQTKQNTWLYWTLGGSIVLLLVPIAVLRRRAKR